MLRPAVHVVLHFIVPVISARLLRPRRWKTAWLLMLSGLLIDLDHLLADRVFDPGRCSIGFHPLHTHAAIGVYAVLALIPRTRLLGIGLLIHIGLDWLDCLWMRFW